MQVYWSHVAGAAVACLLASPVYGQSQTDTHQYDALGRLVASSSAGGVNNGEARSSCYDEAGNRLRYRTSVDASLAACAAPAVQSPPGSTPPPAPPAPPAPSANNAPLTSSDWISGGCYTTISYDVLANDFDPDGHALILKSYSGSSGYGAMIHAVDNILQVTFGYQNGQDVFYYTAADSLGATTQQMIYVNSNCGGGPIFP